MELIKTGVYPVICGFERSDSIVCCKDEGVKETTTANVTSRTPGDVSKQSKIAIRRMFFNLRYSYKNNYFQNARNTLSMPTKLSNPPHCC